MKRIAVGMVAVLALALAGCGGSGGSDATATTATTAGAEATTTTKAPATTTAPTTTAAPTTTTTTTVATTTTTAAPTPESRFVELASSLGVMLDDEEMLAIAAPICEFARSGGDVLHSYIVSSVEPRFTLQTIRDQYAKILASAGAELCPDAGSVIEAEWERIR